MIGQRYWLELQLVVQHFECVGAHLMAESKPLPRVSPIHFDQYLSSFLEGAMPTVAGALVLAAAALALVLALAVALAAALALAVAAVAVALAVAAAVAVVPADVVVGHQKTPLQRGITTEDATTLLAQMQANTQMRAHIEPATAEPAEQKKVNE